MLAVATQNPSAIAETYIRHHMTGIAPGKTVGIALQSRTGGQFGLEVDLLDLSQNATSRLVRWFGGMKRLCLAGFSGDLTDVQMQKLDHFLTTANVKSILAEFGPTGCSLRRFSKTRKIPLYVNFHGYDATVMAKRRTIRRAYELLGRDATGIICGSEYFRHKLIKLNFPSEKIHVIPNGVDTDVFQPCSERDEYLVICVGRLTEKKAPHLSIQAFARAKYVLPHLRLEMIGDGAMRHVCEAQIEALGLSDSVTIHGAKTHAFVAERLAHASVFMQHSITAENGDQESQGISLLEAMASGLPVIATDHNGFSETVLHGVTGYLSAEHDVVAMSDNLIDLMRNRKRRLEMGACGRSRVKAEYELSTSLEKYRKLVCETI